MHIFYATTMFANRRRDTQTPPRVEQRRRLIHTISFDPREDEWVERLVALLDHVGYRTGRSEVVRAALLGLREALNGRSDVEIIKFFVERDAQRRLASVDDAPRLPFP